MSKRIHSLCDNNTVSCQLESCLFSLSPEQFSLLASILGILLTENLDLNHQGALGNFFVSIGQALLTAQAQGVVLQSDKSQKDDMSKELEKLKKQVSALEKKL